MIPEKIKHNQEELRQYLSQFVDQSSGKVDYRDFIQDVQDFDYRKEQFNDGNPARSGASMRSGITDALDYRESRGIYEDDYVVLDQKKVPQNMIEQIESRTVKVNRRLNKLFPD